MSIVLTRVDDRLIHGQVVVAWGQALSPQRIVLADDEIADEKSEHDIFRAGVPRGVEVEFLSVDELAHRVADLEREPERTLVLLADVDSVVRLCAEAPGIRSVNLGGVHEANGRVRRLPYLHLSTGEMRDLEALAARGVTVSAQDVPTAAPVALEDLG